MSLLDLTATQQEIQALARAYAQRELVAMAGERDQASRFDRVMVTAEAPDVPRALLAQLKPNGVLVAPVGRGPVQDLNRYVGDGEGGFTVETLAEVRFVPLLDGVAKDS